MAIARNRVTSGASVEGLAELQSALAAMGPEWPRQLLEVHKEVGQRGAEWSRYQLAGSGTRIQQVAIDSIKGKATAKSAQIGVFASGRAPFALAAVYGAERHTGWYGAAKFQASTGKQFPKWVGNTWDVAVAGQGPYGINDALASHLPDILDFYQKGLDRLTAKAFPE